MHCLPYTLVLAYELNQFQLKNKQILRGSLPFVLLCDLMCKKIIKTGNVVGQLKVTWREVFYTCVYLYLHQGTVDRTWEHGYVSVNLLYDS